MYPAETLMSGQNPTSLLMTPLHCPSLTSSNLQEADTYNREMQPSQHKPIVFEATTLGS